jgi:hypothetical protein
MGSLAFERAGVQPQAGAAEEGAVSGLSNEDCDAALEFLQDSCEAIAASKGELERSKILRNRVRKRIFLSVEEGSVANREALADVHKDVIAADDRYVEAVTAYEALSAKRELRVIQTEVYRTQEASRRQVRP